ncbi:MAG: O-antigen ligase family protein [Planctomycetota bacterium]
MSEADRPIAAEGGRRASAAPSPSHPRVLPALALLAAAATAAATFVGLAERPLEGAFALVGIVGAALVGFLLVRPSTGLLLYFLAAPFFYSYQLLTDGIAIRPLQAAKDLLWVALVAGWALRKFAGREMGTTRFDRDQPHQLAAALFLAYAAVQMLRVVADPFSPRAWAIGLLGFREYVEFLLALLIVPDLVPDARAARRLLHAFLLTAGACLAYGLGQTFLGWPIIRTEIERGLPMPPTSFLGGKYQYGYMLQASAVLLVALAVEKGRRVRARVGLFALAAVTLVGLGFSASRVSIVSFAITLLLFGALERRYAAILLGLLAPVALVAAVPAAREAFMAFLEYGGLADEGRLWVWDATLQAVAANPLFGGGYGLFGGLWFLGIGVRSTTAHSGILAILGTLGICGLAIFFVLLLFLFREGRRQAAAAAEENRGLVHALLALTLGQVPVALLHDVWIASFPATFHFWAFAGLLVSPAFREAGRPQT